MNASSLRIFAITALLAQAPNAAAQDLALEFIASGFDEPTYVTQAPGSPNRFFVVEKRGTIQVVENGRRLATPFLDITLQVDDFAGGGLLGLAFHPDYGVNGRFFVDFVSLIPAAVMIQEYQVSADPNVADPIPVQNIMFEPYALLGGHFGGALHFGPDAKLYASMGDLSDPDPVQDVGTRQGKILRFDVDLPPPFIPPNNPFFNVPGADGAVWMIGFRNPWRFTFDRWTGDVWIGDVGNVSREEVNFVSAGNAAGANFGWPCREGNNCPGHVSCSCSDNSLISPVVDFPHSDPNHQAVIGGYVYRGSAMPAMQGRYFHADYISGHVWSFRLAGNAPTDVIDHTATLEAYGASTGLPSSWGEDLNGELLLLDHMGTVYRIVPDPAVESYCSTSPNSVGSGGVIGSTGIPDISSNAFTLVANQIPNEFGLFFFGDTQALVTPFFDGTLCVSAGQGSGIHRLFPPALASGNATSYQLDLGVSPATLIDAGETWNFQFWYRDLQGGPSGVNTTDALAVTFQP